MPSIEAAGNAPADELDDLFNYDVDADDPFRPFDANLDTAAAPGPPKDEPKADLGIDEEIKVTKPRKQIPKLDQARLLSQNGIPKLRKITKSRLRLKGKGHEFSDVARLLALYQLWLDDLYPRAKFADGLAMIEKLGHSKEMQKMRKGWIHETKSRTIGDGEPDQRDKPSDPSLPTPVATDRCEPDGPSAAPRDRGDEAQAQGGNRVEEAMFISDDEQALEGGPSEDELDLLMAEDAMMGQLETAQSPNKGPRVQNPADDDDFAAEMDVMAEMGL